MAFQPWQPFGRALARAFGRGGNSNRFSLLDQFTTDRAAGSVNGTQAEPTGQTRTVTDTNSKLSITGGVVSVATGGASAGDPGLWYPQVTRQAGLMLLASAVVTTNTVHIGFDNNTAGVISFSIVIGTATLSIEDNGTIKAVGASAAATAYQVAVILRATGAFYFIKGGAFTFWTLIFISVTGSANEFPALGNTFTTDVYVVDNLRIPNALYIPQPIAYDTFTRADGALGSTEGTGPDAQVLIPITWLFTAGIWAIVSNKIVGTPTQGSDVVVNGGFGTDTDWTKGAGWTIGSGTANASAASSNLTATVAPLTLGTWYQSVYTLSAFAAGTVRIRLGGTNCPTHNTNATYTETQRAGGTSLVFVGAGFTGSLDNVSVKALTLKDLFASLQTSTPDVFAYANITLENATSGKQAGLVLNLDSDTAPANFIIVYLDGAGNVVVDECVAGVYANKLAATAITYSAGATLGVSKIGNELRVFYNNVAVGSAVTMTTNTNTKHGVFSTSPLNSIDNVLIMPKGTSGEYEGLSAF